MGRSETTALSVRETFAIRGPLREGELDRICQDLGLTVVWADLPTAVPEVLVNQTVILPLLLLGDAAARRWWLAHVIGHHLLHHANQWHLTADCVLGQEIQAHHFAAWLLLDWPRFRTNEETVEEVAEEAGLPLTEVRQWLPLVRERFNPSVYRGEAAG